MNWLRYAFILLLGSGATFGMQEAKAATWCGAEMTSLNFNSANPADGTTTATITYECLTLFGDRGVAVGMCFAIGPGSPPGSTILDRRMANGPGDQLSFQIYKDPSNTQVWGDSGSQPSYLEIPFEYATPSGFGYETGTIQVHGKLSDLSQAAAGDYSSMFADARLIYSYREGNSPNTPKCDQGNGWSMETFPFEAFVTVPPSCTVVTASDMNFSPGGMPLSGSSTGNLASSSTIDLTCTKRTAWQVGLDDGMNPGGGSRQMCNIGGACIAYQLAQPDGTTPWGDDLDVDTVDGISNGTEQTLTVNGSVDDQPLTQAGRYSDTVKVILTY